MTSSVFLPPDIRSEALQVATNEAFPEVMRILKVFRNSSADLNADEASCLLDFARFLVLRADLHFPYSDAGRVPYLREHEDAFQDINMGLHEKLFHYVGSAFPDLIK
jgi:hypothetical protein